MSWGTAGFCSLDFASQLGSAAANQGRAWRAAAGGGEGVSRMLPGCGGKLASSAGAFVQSSFSAPGTSPQWRGLVGGRSAPNARRCDEASSGVPRGAVPQRSANDRPAVPVRTSAARTTCVARSSAPIAPRSAWLGRHFRRTSRVQVGGPGRSLVVRVYRTRHNGDRRLDGGTTRLQPCHVATPAPMGRSTGRYSRPRSRLGR